MKQNNNKKILVSSGLILLVSLFVFGLSFSNSGNSNSESNNLGIEYGSEVCVYKNSDLIQCSPNVFYLQGAELIEGHMGNEVAADAADWIELCDAGSVGCATPTADGVGTDVYEPHVANGLEAAAGTYSSNGQGNWSIVKTFTATADNLVTNVTRLQNANDDNFSGNSFTKVTLQTDDQLTVNWTIFVR